MPRIAPRRSRLTALLTVLVLALSARGAHASLVAYWSFDGCSSTDAVAGRHLNAYGGPACATGVSGTAWTLDGATQYLERVDDGSFAPGNRAWSVAAWVRSSGDTTAGHSIASWYRCGANPLCSSGDGALWALWDLGGHAQWDVRDDIGQDVWLTDSTVSLADRRWHLVVGTLSAAHDSIELYVDGVRRKAAHTSFLGISGIAPIEVGRWYRTGWGSPDYYYDGTIDEVRVYDERLSAATIAALYVAGTTSVSPAAVTTPTLTLDRIAPNPTHGAGVRLAFTTALAAPVRVLVLDVTGRRVSERVFEEVGVGAHEVMLDGPDAIAPGVYMVRVTQGATSVSRRVTVMR